MQNVTKCCTKGHQWLACAKTIYVVPGQNQRQAWVKDIPYLLKIERRSQTNRFDALGSWIQFCIRIRSCYFPGDFRQKSSNFYRLGAKFHLAGMNPSTCTSVKNQESPGPLSAATHSVSIPSMTLLFVVTNQVVHWYLYLLGYKTLFLFSNFLPFLTNQTWKLLSFA